MLLLSERKRDLNLQIGVRKKKIIFLFLQGEHLPRYQKNIKKRMLKQ